MARNFPGVVRGADIAFISDLPPAGGMGSSSALITGVFLALAEVNRLAARDEYWHNIGSKTDLAGYLGAIENGQTFGTLEGDCGVGTCGGSEDHTAILCAEPNHVSQYAFCPIEFEKMLLVPPGYVFAVAASGVTAEKSRADAREKYNTASRLASALLELWRRETGRDDPHLAAALGSSADAVERLQAIVKATRRRLVFPRGASGPPGAFHARKRRDHSRGGRCLGSRRSGRVRPAGRSIRSTPPSNCWAIKRPKRSFWRRRLAGSARRRHRRSAEVSAAASGRWSKSRRPTDFLAAWAGVYGENFPQHTERAGFFATGAGPAAFRVC